MPDSVFRSSTVLIFTVGLLTACTPLTYQSKTSTSNIIKPEKTIKKRLQTVFDAYQREDLSIVLDSISYDYQGNRSRLESNLDEQLQRVDSIEYSLFIDGVTSSNGIATVDFHWDRRWRDVDSGRMTMSEGETEMRFEKENGTYRIVDIRKRNPFL